MQLAMEQQQAYELQVKEAREKAYAHYNSVKVNSTHSLAQRDRTLQDLQKQRASARSTLRLDRQAGCSSGFVPPHSALPLVPPVCQPSTSYAEPPRAPTLYADIPHTSSGVASTL